ncbi:UPF0481 protein At3g47200-like [Rosa rugosa]|uniref:UPF0481 protein At3g47200-like n=1 Tax=Rosa rugosa TaxID=74645 RepID=UPI002B409CB5|nr:UPF0481 protein At3g47200-like [Rosa rugosa]
MLAQSFEISKPKIQRVPHMLRDHVNFEEKYEPRVIAIGPLHHGEARYEAGEKFKSELTEKFIGDSGCQGELMHKIIEDNINELRDYYDWAATESYTDKALADLLFLDGCATLQFIYSFINNELASFRIPREQVASAEQDLFLVENQLPYMVLRLLMCQSVEEYQLKTAVDDFVWVNVMVAGGKRKRRRQLEYLVINMEEPTHLLELLRTEMLGPPKFDARKKLPRYRRPLFRNIGELKAGGIQLKPSKTSTLRDISFTRGPVAFLNLPPIVLDDSMERILLNLKAFEMCPHFQNESGVTSYICFMHSLINDADDVKQLRSAGVLYNRLGSDEAVAQYFNQIGTDLMPNSDAYSNVRAKIEEHYRTIWKPTLSTWLVQFGLVYLNSPWTILATLGVLAGLGLTGIQTWYTISPLAPPFTACDAVCEYMKKQLKIE